MRNAEKIVGLTRTIAIEDLPINGKHIALRDKSRLDAGFWTVTLERFFILERFMMQMAITKGVSQPIIHIENDIIVYENLEKLAPIFARNYPGKIGCTLDSPDRVIAGFMYIDSIRPLAKFTEFVIDTLAISNNDMISFAKFVKEHRPEYIDTLPIIPPDNKFDTIYYNHIDEFNGIFDAAAIGQFIGGVDPRNIPGNTRGFINETCIFKCSDYNIQTHIEIDGFIRPAIIWNDKIYPIFNLHIHSKNLKPYLAKRI